MLGARQHSMVFCSRQVGLLMTLLLGACGDDDRCAAVACVDGSVEPDAAVPDFGAPPECTVSAPAAPLCAPLDSDYAPGADDEWLACISDDGEYHRIEDTISSVQRVAAFESMAALLFDPSRDPSADDFVQARILYQEDEGLDSRVVRRYDPRVSVPDDTDCTQVGVPEQYPAYCIGPSTLQPMILQALNRGAEMPDRRLAARVEAGLLWFLYISSLKESLSCTSAPKDCDSSYAYYTGGESARGGVGLARYVAEASPSSHDRVWDGLLALRCWRDLDSDVPAADLELRDRARDQLRRALTHGVAQILRARLAALCAADSGAAAAYHGSFVQAMFGAVELDLTEAQRAQVESLRSTDNPHDVDAMGLAQILDESFMCP